MSGLLRRLRRRRPATADENRSPTAGSSEPVAARGDAPAEPGGDRPVPAEDQPTQMLPATGEQAAVAPGEPDRSAATPAEPDRPAAEQTSPGAEWAKTAVAPDGPATPESQPTAFAAQRHPARDLPAGLDPGDLTTAPAASARRGKLRRRLRYLRHVRELLLRDLGGFTYEIHRTAGGTPQESHRKLTAAKTGRIAALDAEVVALEAQLGEPHADPVLREAGIGGTCPECGELHASDARYCARCGAPLDARVRAKRDAAAAAPATGSHPTPEPQPASVLWAGGSRPSTPKEPAAEEERQSGATGRWLAGQPTTFGHAARPGGAHAAANAGEPAAEEQPEPKAAEEAARTGEPVADTAAAGADAPAADAPKAGETAAETDRPATTDEATTTDEPAAETDQPPATADEPTAADQPPTATDEPPTTVDEPTGDAPATEAEEPADAADAAPPAKPKRARASRAKKPPKPRAEAPADDTDFEPGPNGRRDEDVPPPVTSGDPLTSRRERRP